MVTREYHLDHMDGFNRVTFTRPLEEPDDGRPVRINSEVSVQLESDKWRSIGSPHTVTVTIDAA